MFISSFFFSILRSLPNTAVYAVTFSAKYSFEELQEFAGDKWRVFVDARSRKFIEDAGLHIPQFFSVFEMNEYHTHGNYYTPCKWKCYYRINTMSIQTILFDTEEKYTVYCGTVVYCRISWNPSCKGTNFQKNFMCSSKADRTFNRHMNTHFWWVSDTLKGNLNIF